MRRCLLGLLFTFAACGPGDTPAPASNTAPDDGAVVGSCCSEPEGCRHQRVVDLPPARDAATDKELRLRAVHERALAGEHVFFSNRPIDAARERLARAEGGSQAMSIITSRWTLALYLMRVGQVDEAVQLLDRCVTEAQTDPTTRDALLPELLYQNALAWFRLGERRNCIARHTAESCIFPLTGEAIHVDQVGSLRAQELLQRLIALDAEERSLEARWLINIVHMTLGTYPQDVPADQLIGPEKFASEQPLGHFTDIAAGLGLDRFDRAGSVVLEDFDGDGLLDVLTSSFDTALPLQLHRNRGERGFEDVTTRAGLEHQLGGAHLMQADVDGDGRLDVLVLRGFDLEGEGIMPDSLLRQTDTLVFEDVTARAGLEFDAPTQTACFSDVDRDGDLDLFVAYQALGDFASGDDVPAVVGGTLRLFHNDGTGRFSDATPASGLVSDAVCMAAVFGDVDGDGWPDLFLSHEKDSNQLWINRRDGSFEELAAERGVTVPDWSRAAWFFDPDNDGDLDLFVTYSHHDFAVRAVTRYVIDGTIETETPRLYENDGSGHFTDVTAKRGLRRVVYPLAASFGDLDGDGFDDIYLATGAHEMEALWPNLALRNDGGERFRDVTVASGLGHLQKGQAVAFGDLDVDGDQDLFVQVGGHFPDDGFGNVLFENPGFGSHWLALDLVGTASNRFGVGARIRARIATPAGTRDVYAHVGADGPSGRGSLRAELGLGDATAVERLEISWPGGTTQSFTDVALDTLVVVHEDRETLQRRALTPFRLGAVASRDTADAGGH